MFTVQQFVRKAPSAVSAFLLVLGLALILIGWLPVQIVGIACIVGAILVPFLAIEPKRERTETDTGPESQSATSTDPPDTRRPAPKPSLPTMSGPGRDPT